MSIAKPYGNRALSRRAVVVALGLLPIQRTALAQVARKPARVGVLGTTPPAASPQASFKQGLVQLGYAEGERVVLVLHDAAGVTARLPSVAAELVRADPDVIFARGPAAVAAAIEATKTIPIVAVDLESDPLALGYAKTLARPGGNVTGVFLDLPELSAKQLQLVREVVPGMSRVGLVGDAVANATQFEATQRAARTLGIQAETFQGRSAAELDAALEAAHRSGVGAVLVFSSPIVSANSARIAALARDKQMPMVSLFTEFAKSGGLLSYGPSLVECFRRGGVYVARILNGEKPAELAIERPERFELVINIETAKRLGLTVPQSLILRADEVVED